ncbi:MAG: hypothetical protein HQK89_00920 [Nitrospirae bacterium]|nr:hypothetical protein [Nitrospirota bacterium]
MGFHDEKAREFKRMNAGLPGKGDSGPRMRLTALAGKMTKMGGVDGKWVRITNGIRLTASWKHLKPVGDTGDSFPRNLKT